MLLCAHKSGFLLILALCFFENISSSPQRKVKQNAASNTTMNSPTNQTSTTGSTTKMVVRLTESYLPATMQALAYYIELLQYEPLYTTTAEPPFTLSTTPLTLPNAPSSNGTPRPPVQQPGSWWNQQNPSSQRPTATWTQPTSSWWSTSSPRPPTVAWTQSPWTTQKPVTWWSPPSTTTTQRPVTWWSPPSTTTTQKPVWWHPGQSDTPDPENEVTVTSTTTTQRPTTQRPTTTRRPLVSTTTPSWWHPETTPIHSPGNFAPEPPRSNSANSGTERPVSKPSSKPQFGDLSVLSIANFPYFEHFVPTNTKTFEKKPEYEFLHHYPAELLQDIEDEPYKAPDGTDQEMANEFRRVFDDFYTRVRIFAPVTGKKRIPPTRPYVLFLILYDLCKREAKRLGLQEYTGYSHEMLMRLHETSKYSAERQLYTLMNDLLQQKSIVANDVTMRITEIMTDLINPNSVTAKALHILPALKFEF